MSLSCCVEPLMAVLISVLRPFGHALAPQDAVHAGLEAVLRRVGQYRVHELHRLFVALGLARPPLACVFRHDDIEVGVEELLILERIRARRGIVPQPIAVLGVRAVDGCAEIERMLAELHVDDSRLGQRLALVVGQTAVRPGLCGSSRYTCPLPSERVRRRVRSRSDWTSGRRPSETPRAGMLRHRARRAVQFDANAMNARRKIALETVGARICFVDSLRETFVAHVQMHSPPAPGCLYRELHPARFARVR